MHRLAGALAGVSVLAAGCASLEYRLPEVDSRPARTHLDTVPFHPQLDFHCGPATLLTVLEHTGVRPDYQRVVDRVYVPGLEGSLQLEMMAAARGFGRIPYRIPGELDALAEQVEAGHPVLVLKNLRLETWPAWHYAVVIGYDRPGQTILLRSGEEPELEIPARRFMTQWDRAGRWGIVVLEPGDLPARPERERMLRALADFDVAADPRPRRAAWMAVAERWPDEAVAWLGVGNASFEIDDWPVAEQAFGRALEADPEHWPARLNLAAVMEATGRHCAGLEWLDAGPPPEALAARVETASARLAAACSKKSP